MTVLSSIDSKWCGEVPYAEGLALQESELARLRHEDRTGTLLGLEHPTVITLGRRADILVDLVDSSSSIPLHHIERGGQATLHSPGQLVIYPVVNIRRLGFSVREWVDLLLSVTAATLQGLGIEASAAQGSGLWTGTGKIAFLGLRIAQGLSSHGLAINLQNDLSLGQQIRSCGVQGARLDRVLDHGVSVSLEEFFHLWVAHFQVQAAGVDSAPGAPYAEISAV